MSGERVLSLRKVIFLFQLISPSLLWKQLSPAGCACAPTHPGSTARISIRIRQFTSVDCRQLLDIDVLQQNLLPVSYQPDHPQQSEESVLALKGWRDNKSGSECLTPEDKDLLTRVLTQEMLDEVVRHGKDFRGCRRKENMEALQLFSQQLLITAGKAVKFTFDDKQSFQAFGVVLLKHLEDLMMQKNITGWCQATIGRCEDLLLSGLRTSPNVSIAGFHKCFRPRPSTS